MSIHELFELIHAQSAVTVHIKPSKNCFNLSCVQFLGNLENNNSLYGIIQLGIYKRIYYINV